MNFALPVLLAVLATVQVGYASTIKTYDRDTVSLLDAVGHCPSQGNGLSDLMKISDAITKVEYSSPRPASSKVRSTSYVITGSVMPVTENDQTKEVATLTVKQTIDETDVLADALAKVTYECLLKRL